MPEATFIIRGAIVDFTRLDNLYVSLKRETEKLLKDWTIDIQVKYTEKMGEIPKE
jgi:hypothetical protein